MAENLETPSFGNFSIENTMEMGPGGAELLNDLLSPETSTSNPDQIQEIVKNVEDPAPTPKPDVPKGKESGLNGVVEMNTNEPIDFIALGLEIQKTNQYLRITGTDKVLVVKSEWVLTNEMQNNQ